MDKFILPLLRFVEQQNALKDSQWKITPLQIE